MIGMLFGSWLTWQGLYVGVEQSNTWRNPFAQPGVSAPVLALASVNKRVAVHGYYLQPLQPNGGPALLEIGVSVRVF